MKMNKSTLINLLGQFMDYHSQGSSQTAGSKNFEAVCDKVCEELNCSFIDVAAELSFVDKYYFSDRNISEWKYLMTGLYVISKINEITKNSSSDELLSVKEIKTVKACINNLTNLGIYTKLQPKVPFYLNETFTVTEDIFFQYNLLKCTIICYCEWLKNPHMRVLLLTDTLRAILTGLHQIAYCPLNKNANSMFTDEMYSRLLEEKKMAAILINTLRESIHPKIYVTETMSIFRHDAPPWFKKALSQTLTKIMFSSNGIRNIAIAILDTTDNDKTKSWQALDVIFRLVASCKYRTDFRSNICRQILQLLDETNEDCIIFERLFITCTKKFYLEEEDLSKDVFLRKIVTNLLQFTYTDYKYKEGDITDMIVKSVRLFHGLFVEKTAESPCLPTDMLKPILGVMFRIYTITINTEFKECNNEIKEILLRFLRDYPDQDDILFDSLLFSINDSHQILPFRNHVILKVENNSIVLKRAQYITSTPVSENFDSTFKLLEGNTKILLRLFGYLLRCIVNREKYFQDSNTELLTNEMEVIDALFERRIVIYKALSTLSENKSIQKEIIDNPDDIINFVKDVVKRTVKTNLHRSTEFESDAFQTIFTVIMILHALVSSNSNNNSLDKFRVLQEPLEKIRDESCHKEMVNLTEQILNSITYQKTKSFRMHIEEVRSKSELDIILEDICDPLLPVRGHGLMALKKLVEKRDEAAMEKKQYILTIFQQSLKNEDSFIYLSAVDGLAALADVFPDSVISILCDEYSDFEKKDDDRHENRMKLGEVLVRITKTLGEMAPKYKSLLLNTFLNGTKHDDHLVRASSLSNLGEICRVLGYKLGTIVTEILGCVHAIITTDKAIEARRAAVTVIRQLLVGLESEMISFLKEDILPVYRTLKQIYRNDKDDVMRLQAQLALEELNENMKSFVFPKPQINAEKKIIMLN